MLTIKDPLTKLHQRTTVSFNGCLKISNKASYFIKTLTFCHIYAMLLWPLIGNFTIYVTHKWIIDFNTQHYMRHHVINGVTCIKLQNGSTICLTLCH